MLNFFRVLPGKICQDFNQFRAIRMSKQTTEHLRWKVILLHLDAKVASREFQTLVNVAFTKSAGSTSNESLSKGSQHRRNLLPCGGECGVHRFPLVGSVPEGFYGLFIIGQ